MDDVAEDLDLEAEVVLEVLAASSAHSPHSVDMAPWGEPEGSGEDDALSSVDLALAGADDRITVDQLIDGLEPREQEIVRLRFWEDLTQSEIADQVGLSQMHVSRLLRRSFETMREIARAREAATGGRRHSAVRGEPDVRSLTSRSP